MSPFVIGRWAAHSPLGAALMGAGIVFVLMAFIVFVMAINAEYAHMEMES